MPDRLLPLVDTLVTDKRLLVEEQEFSATLKVATREGNTLTEQLRKAWDGKSLGVMTRSSPLRSMAQDMPAQLSDPNGNGAQRGGASSSPGHGAPSEEGGRHETEHRCPFSRGRSGGKPRRFTGWSDPVR
jgi:hypothetical protein